MKVSLSWLKEYVEVTLPPEALADALTMAGLEVDSVEDRYHYLETVRVARILSVNPHPNADRLTCCDISLGDRTTTVVCGAPNVKKDMLAPCALPGTVLPDGRTLEAGVIIRGEKSDGMLCSALELALGDDAAGIMELDADLTPGTALNQALGLTDPVFEIDLTPNRPDCLSIIGVAREVAAFQGAGIKYPEPVEPAARDAIAEMTSVKIEDPDLCPRYAARLIVDIDVAPSPFWLRDRLISVGLKPINNIVDITNFVMLETGQPLHAFDFDQLHDNRIVVRAAEAGEKFTTLDEKERTLPPNALMICDGEKSVAIGGVMGGLNSEIESDTRRVLLESACFNPVSIRKTAKKTGLNTDASHRFERGVDPAGTVRALNRAAYLIAGLGDGTLVDGIIDENPRPYEKKAITLSVAATNRRLGTALSAAQMTAYLTAIEFEVKAGETDTLLVVPPAYRVDVTRPEDLSEEIARLFGYNNISTTFPLVPAEGRKPEPVRALRERIRNFMTGHGFCETVNYSFVSGETPDRLGLPEGDPRRAGVPILNPISDEQSVMRTSLVPGLLEAMGRNLSVQNKTLMLYEIGNTFYATKKTDSLPVEKEVMAALWTGERAPFSWHGKATMCDFFDIKGVAEALVDNLGIRNAVFTREPAEDCAYTRPGATARVQATGKTLGRLGEVAPAVLKRYDLKQGALILELDVAALLEAGTETIDAHPIPKYPATARDITLIINESIESVSLTGYVEKLDEPLAESVTIFDVYTGDPIQTGKKSVSIRITYRSGKGTLEDAAVNSLHKSISARLIDAFDADLPA